MLSILRSNQPFAIILVGLTWALGVVWNWWFIEPEVSSWIFPQLNIYFSASSWRILIFQSLIQLLTVGVIHRTYNSNEYILGGNYFAAWIYALFAALFSAVFPAHPFLLLHLLIILAMKQVFDVYRQNDVQHHYFNASFFLGVSMLIVPSSFVLALSLLVSLAYTRSGIWREWAWSIVGFVLPFLIGICIVWLAEDLDLIQQWGASVVGIDPQSQLNWLAIPFGIWFLFGLKGLINSYRSSSNKARNTKSTSLIFLLGCLSFVILNYDASWAALIFAALANVALVLPYHFIGDKIKLHHRVLFGLLLIASIWPFVSTAIAR